MGVLDPYRVVIKFSLNYVFPGVRLILKLKCVHFNQVIYGPSFIIHFATRKPFFHQLLRGNLEKYSILRKNMEKQ